MVLEKTLKSPLDCKKIRPIIKYINPEYWKDWMDLEELMEGLIGIEKTGRTDAKAEVPILWPPDAKN